MRALTITALNILARSAQLGFLLLLGNVYGISSGSDTVFLLAAPFYALSAVLHSVADVAVMPSLHRARMQRCETEFRRWMVRGFLVAASVGSLLLVVVIGLAFERARWDVLLLLVPVPIFASLTTVASGVLNSRGRFHHAAAGPVFAILPAALIILLLPLSAVTLAFALAAFEAGRWLPLAIAGRTRRPAESEPVDSNVLRSLRRRMVRASGWQAVGAFLLGMNPVVDLLWANTLHAGAVTQVEYAVKIWSGIPLLFSGILVVAFSRWSMAEARGSFDLRVVTRLSGKVFLLMLALAPLLMLIVHPLIRFAFGFGAMNTVETGQQASLVVAYLCGLPPMVAGLFLVRAFSAIAKLQVLATGALASLLVNAIGDWLLVGWLGLNGIGIATAASYLASFIVLLIAAFRVPARDENPVTGVA